MIDVLCINMDGMTLQGLSLALKQIIFPSATVMGICMYSVCSKFPVGCFLLM